MKVMYDGANSRLRLNDYFGERFEVTVDVHQGSILSPLLFAIVIEALSLSSVLLVALGNSYVQMILSS